MGVFNADNTMLNFGLITCSYMYLGMNARGKRNLTVLMMASILFTILFPVFAGRSPASAQGCT